MKIEGPLKAASGHAELPECITLFESNKCPDRFTRLIVAKQVHTEMQGHCTTIQ